MALQLLDCPLIQEMQWSNLTKNKIRPFFHIKNFKDGIADAVLGRPMTQAGRSSEYVEGYEFGLTLFV